MCGFNSPPSQSQLHLQWIVLPLLHLSRFGILEPCLIDRPGKSALERILDAVCSWGCAALLPDIQLVRTKAIPPPKAVGPHSCAKRTMVSFGVRSAHPGQFGAGSTSRFKGEIHDKLIRQCSNAVGC